MRASGFLCLAGPMAGRILISRRAAVRADVPARPAPARGRDDDAMADPIHQFELKPLVKLGRIGQTEIAFTNSALYMAAAIRHRPAHDLRHPPRLAGAGAAAVAGRDRLRVRGRHAARAAPARRHEVLPLRVHAVHLHPRRNMLGMIPGVFTVTSHIVVTAALAAWCSSRCCLSALQERPALPQAVRAAGRADLILPLVVADRDHLVPVAPDQPLGAPVRQHAGRPHHAQGVRRLRRHAAGRRRCRRARRRCRCSWP